MVRLTMLFLFSNISMLLTYLLDVKASTFYSEVILGFIVKDTLIAFSIEYHIVLPVVAIQ